MPPSTLHAFERKIREQCWKSTKYVHCEICHVRQENNVVKFHCHCGAKVKTGGHKMKEVLVHWNTSKSRELVACPFVYSFTILILLLRMINSCSRCLSTTYKPTQNQFPLWQAQCGRAHGVIVTTKVNVAIATNCNCSC